MIIKKSIGNKFICIFFFLMLILPASFQMPRGILLLLILFFIIKSNTFSLFRYDRTLLVIGLINIFFSFIFTLNGIVRSTPGAIAVSTVYLIWPVLYLYFIGLSDSKSNLVSILNTIIYGGLGSVGLILVFIYNNFFGFPLDITYLTKSQDFGIFWGGGAVELNSMNLATVLYTFIFVLTLLLMPTELNHFSKKKNLIRFTLLVSLALIFISARRAFWLVCAISPFIILLLLKIAGVNLRLKRFIIPCLVFCSVVFTFVGYLALDNDKLFSEFNSSFEFDNPAAESNYLRKEQFDALISGWEDNWLIGAGLGAHAQGSTRDDKAPWAYELSYIALLFHTGIVGILVYGSSIFWIIYESIIICRKNKYYVSFLLPQITGLICFLLVNASNPYLGKFDYLWTIFLPLATINAIKLDVSSDYSDSYM
ncbi:hypothetical protein [Flavobacterium sp. 123]|jgi:hypothetical protein|uniref:hypothetical protein n=1 Tax=Flavobacterium sp. 123 TaxID=2135627 RepID=UPI000F29BF07|nr:hypothetical protein [Flavobacterium sp. 123]RKS99993.1 hypothetical protein C8C88_1806 [Flavobacterium sp. 123]